MPQLAQNVDLGDEELLLPLAHRAIVDLLPDQYFVIGKAPDLVYLTEATLSNLFDHFILRADRATQSSN